jgi:hypothetical protein
MDELDKRLFVGIKISPNLQRELDQCARANEHFFKEDKPEALQIVTLGEEKFIGRFVRDGFPICEIDNVSRNVHSIIRVITPGYRVPENSLRIYGDSKVPAQERDGKKRDPYPSFSPSS